MGINSKKNFFLRRKSIISTSGTSLTLHRLGFRLQWSDSFVPQALPEGENYLGKVMGEVCNHTTFVVVEKSRTETLLLPQYKEKPEDFGNICECFFFFFLFLKFLCEFLKIDCTFTWFKIQRVQKGMLRENSLPPCLLPYSFLALLHYLKPSRISVSLYGQMPICHHSFVLYS